MTERTRVNGTEDTQETVRQTAAQQAAGQQIAGIVDSIVYQSEESGYTVCVVEDSATGDPITVVGTIPYLSEGDKITVQGDWVNHPTSIRQTAQVALV